MSYLANNKEYFLQKFNIEKIGIFGSFARGEQTEKSDIDIIFEMPRGTEDIFEKKLELKDLLEKQFNCDVDICRERAIKPVYKELILKDVIYA